MLSYRDFLPSRRFRSTLALSPDGKRVAYVDDSSGQFNVVVQELSGGEPQRLTSFVDSSVKRTAWHPDGESLLFVADSQGNEKDQIFHQRLDGSPPRLLAGAPGVQYVPAFGEPFSPCGERMAYAGNDRSAGDQDVLEQDLASGRVHRWCAQRGRFFAGHWSRDGRKSRWEKIKHHRLA